MTSEPAPAGKPAALVPNALFYAAYFGSAGISIPHLSPWLKARGLSGAEIALVASFQPLVAIVAPLAWGFLADRTRRPAPLLRLAAAGAAAGVVMAALAASTPTLAAAFFAAAFFAAPISTLADALTIERCRRTPGTDYTRVRLWGSVGFVAAGLVASEALAAMPGLNVPAMLAALYGCGFAATLFVRPVDAGGAARPPSVRDAAALLKNRTLLLLMAGGTLHWAALAPFHVFLGIHVRDLGAGPRAAGAAISIAVALEVAAMAFYPRLARRVQPAALIAIAYAASALRWALVAAVSDPLAVVGLQTLHFFSFGFFYPSAIALLAREVPPEVRASGQALYVAVVFGLGTVVGNAAFGPLYDAAGGRPLFAAAAVLELLPLALALVLLRAERRRAASDAAPPARTPPR